MKTPQIDVGFFFALKKRDCFAKNHGFFLHFCKTFPVKFCKMKNNLTIFICLDGSTVVGAGKTLSKLIGNTPRLAAKSYHYYYRKIKGKNEASFIVNDEFIKIVKFEYAK